MNTPDLFTPPTTPDTSEIPLPERLRPANLDEFFGQEHLLAPGKPLRRIIEKGLSISIILWGPPGTGKTTLARLIANATPGHFVEYSAVLSGIKKIKEVMKHAEFLRSTQNLSTIMFIDEIHRFNKAQQDAFLSYVERGIIKLIGATTENPSFEVISALLSRCRVFTLESLQEKDLVKIIRNALGDPVRGIKKHDPVISDATIQLLARLSSGDARIALGALDFATSLAQKDSKNRLVISDETILHALRNQPCLYDKSGEKHFNFISALHKSLRGSDAQAALYWLARMLEGGEDPLYIARRMIRFASEDIGLADPQALNIAISAKNAYHFLGSPEGHLALAQCALYLATAPKSNSVYTAFKAARKSAQETANLSAPLHIRNAPTKLMSQMGYGKGYQYDHEMEDNYSGQEFLPEELAGTTFYVPGRFGFEREISKRLEWWRKKKENIREKKKY